LLVQPEPTLSIATVKQPHRSQLLELVIATSRALWIKHFYPYQFLVP